MSEERLLRTERVFEGKLISLRVDEVELGDGRRARREVVEHPGAVAILAWDGERLTLVRQWRHPTAGELLEIPAGTLEPDEAPAATARRELAEECGLAAATWEEGPRFWTAPGFCDELMHFFLASGLSTAEHEPAADEGISVERLTLGEALAAIEDGRISDAKSMVGICWLARRLDRTRVSP